MLKMAGILFVKFAIDRFDIKGNIGTFIFDLFKYEILNLIKTSHIFQYQKKIMEIIMS